MGFRVWGLWGLGVRTWGGLEIQFKPTLLIFSGLRWRSLQGFETVLCSILLLAFAPGSKCCPMQLAYLSEFIEGFGW